MALVRKTLECIRKESKEKKTVESAFKNFFNDIKLDPDCETYRKLCMA